MLVLGIAGSPRRNGNSEILLDEALSAAAAMGVEVEKVVLSELQYLPCISCGACDKTGICSLEDEMQALYEKIGAAQALIFASPIYFYTVSAWAKGAIDRAQALWSRKYVLKDPRYTAAKAGYFIAVGATSGSKLFDGASLTMKYYFDAAGYAQAGSLLVRGMDEKGAVLALAEKMDAARELGQRAAISCRLTAGE
ncbi:MAG: putative NAD(P)H-dependent FMN-containing oxidoreductase YwqN [Dehalococcoidia bacterium]|nr:putative NAD(P)H-dependent FMN-containing oxidoreductase YwqN [Bacillota bacterium]MBT9142236.1 putative NAD(P)H-dependent FMN-containing oxidoreductase YwqN [Bacillota bacterium]